MCVRAIYLEDDWSIHHKRGKVGGIPALVMEVTQQHLYKEFCKCANTLGGKGGPYHPHSFSCLCLTFVVIYAKRQTSLFACCIVIQ